ncbi:MAG TPA: dihydroxy-acid dehydratase, partial [Streptosporangiaceae bacterium]|nr:dihydroxy-acid dehydratase [Streptosporangiaceae bacterium]
MIQAFDPRTGEPVGEPVAETNDAEVDAISRRVPWLANVKPSGTYLMEDFYYAGGLPALLGQLA